MRFTHLLNRNGHYYFRYAVPLSLVPVIGKREIIHSLRTKDYAQAKARCWTMLNATQEAFQRARLHDYGAVHSLSGVLTPKPMLPVIDNAPKQPTGRNLPALSLAKEEVTDKVSKVFEQYLAEAKGEGEKGKQRKRSCLRLWIDVIGDMPAQNINKAHAREFKQMLMKLPSNADKRFKGKSVKLINLEAIPETKRLSVTSINHYLGFMRAFTNWMIQNGYYEANNPFIGLSLKDNERAIDKREPFSKQQLTAIFGSPVFMGSKSAKPRHRYIEGNEIIKDGFYWVTLIALYSGARMQEICQLYVSDIKEVDGIWCFDINEDGTDKQLKTLSSKRRVPIHPILIERGLLEHKRQQERKEEARLFPDLPRSSNGTYSGVFSKRFNKFLMSMKIKTSKTSFHSFRHNFIDELRRSGVQREVREALVGHHNQSKAHDNYGSMIEIKTLNQAILSYSTHFERIS